MLMLPRLMRIFVLVPAVLAAVSPGSPARADFLVSISNNAGTRNEVDRFTENGSFVGVFASGNGMSTPEGLSFGPDGNLYVANFASGAILRFNGATGAFINQFASSAATPESVIGLAFGPNGNLYVSNF